MGAVLLAGLIILNVQVGLGGETNLFGLDVSALFPDASADELICDITEEECYIVGGLWFPGAGEDGCCLVQTGTDPCPPIGCQLAGNVFCCMDSGVQYKMWVTF